jgi:signal transduction histidine kinase
MKLQLKIATTLLISIIASAILSIVVINILFIFFDKSYNWYNVEKISLDIIKEINSFKDFDTEKIKTILLDEKKETEYLDFTLADKNRDFIFSTSKRKHVFNVDNLKKKIEKEEKNLETKNKKRIKFIEFFDNREFISMKPIIINNDLKGYILISVKREFLPPFFITINKEKILFLYIIIFSIITLLIFFSYILVIVFTIPLIKRLNILYHKINNFELDKKNSKINDPIKDEIGTISKTFDMMVDKINQDHTEKLNFFKERQELLKNLSHDFRTPLTSILGYSISLDDGVYENEEEQKKYYKIIRKKAEYMTELFDEMMELSRLNTNTFVLKKNDFDITELLREIIIEYLPQLENEKFFIETKIPSSLIINGDKDRLSRAIRNIIDNVIKHAFHGKYIGFFITKKDEKTITIKIKDKGKGIEKENFRKIFDRFYHISAQGGMGLGLSISKEIIESHNGSINVDSTLNTGSIFIIELPIK